MYYRYERILRATVVVVVGMTMAACSTAASPNPSSNASQMPMESGAMEMELGALGEAAEAADAERTVHITADDQLVFGPNTVEVQVDETITFEIENTGTVDHEFVLGSAEWQEQHEADMQAGEMEMGEEPNELEVPAGETVSLTWRFTEAGTTEYGCHEPGHFDGGPMVGTITVSP
jgi:uncharacterized cupredoxin-like copper-binding protein